MVKNVLHPTRVAIVEKMAGGSRCSPNGLAGEIGVPLGSVAYHVRELLDAGVLRRAGTQQVRGATEHFYRLDGRRVSTVAAQVRAVRELAERAERALSG